MRGPVAHCDADAYHQVYHARRAYITGLEPRTSAVDKTICKRNAASLKGLTSGRTVVTSNATSTSFRIGTQNP